ncbi:MAG: sialate O-acetylesterase [Defluviitaleaceae bacterium]|nr:sialate O-acetylesterase [Defluviitaleaceae bacterium]
MIKLLDNIFKNGVVLQRDMPIKIWSAYGSPASSINSSSKDDSVTLKFNEDSYETKRDNNGYFEFILPAKSFGGPHKMSVSSGGLVEEIEDVFIGDVWVCAGQSNMELPMIRVKRMFSEELKNSENNYIRQYHVPLTSEFHEEKRQTPNSEWVSVKKGELENFSAVGFFFASKLYEKYKVPIGLIMTAVGGTPVEAWMSRRALASYPEKILMADECQKPGFMENIISSEQKMNDAWYTNLNEFDRGLNEKWYSELFDDSDWKSIHLTTPWDEVADLRATGAIWFRKTIELTEEQAAEKDVSLILGCIIDADEVYVNGEKIGGITYRYPPRDYKVTNLKKGLNTIAIRVIASHTMGGFINDKSYKLLFVNSELDLKDNWLYKRALSCPPLPPTTFFRNRPTGNYNGMIAPLHSYGIKGVIWYQGESNTGEPEGYSKKFSKMITDWRDKWNQEDFPFLYVQLANWSPKGSLMNWELLREEQTKTLELHNTRMVVSIDVGEHNDLHPLNKKTIGERLALEALSLAYGEDIVSTSPKIKSIERPIVGIELASTSLIKEDKLILSFDTHGSKLALSNSPIDEKVRGLSIWVENIEISTEGIIKDNTVIIETPFVSKVTHVSYAFTDDPAEANLCNEEKLPAVPFKKKLD